MLDAPGRLYVRQGTIYVDSGADPVASRLEVVTPAGTARDVGTQFELQVAGAALRLRVREGAVSIDRGGQSLTGGAGEQIAIDVLGGVSRGRHRAPMRRHGSGRKPSRRPRTWTASRPPS